MINFNPLNGFQRFGWLVVLLATIGCDSAPPPKSIHSELFEIDLNVPGNLERAYAEIGKRYEKHSSIQTEVLKTARTFDDYPKFVKSLEAAEEITVYQGTPREGAGPDVEVVELEGSGYAALSIILGSAQTEAVKSLFSRADAVFPCVGITACEFHADWRISWVDGSDAWRAVLCFGCDEMLVFKGDQLLVYCSIRDPEAILSVMNEAKSVSSPLGLDESSPPATYRP